MDMVTQVTEKINGVFSDEYLDKLADETGFIRRKRKIMARQFLEKIIVLTMSTPHVSLEDLVAEFESPDLKISKPAIHKKFNPKTVEFTQKVLQSLLEGVFNEHRMGLEILPKIHDVIIGDSSKIRLSDLLKTHFPDQRNSEAASVKIQAVMNVLDNQLKSLEITGAREPDQGYKKYLDYIQENDLWIGDLGYFSLSSFNKIVEKKAFFLSRYFRRTQLYDPISSEKINLRQVLAQSTEASLSFSVRLGSGGIICRCVAVRLSEKEYEKRLRNLKEKSRKDPREKLKREDVLNLWSILVTNLTEPLDPFLLWKLYMLRWQIELLFKMMKTFLNLRAVETANPYRSMVSIYASLMTMTLLTLVTMTLPDQEVSLYKACKWFTRHMGLFFEYIHDQKQLPVIWLREKISRFGRKEARKKRPSTRQILGWRAQYA
jgi:hypothetical protein